MTKRKTCFVISPIGSADSPQRKRADTVLKHIFKQALEPMGYDVVRADEISVPGSITLQVLEKVLESEVVIADLTDHNPNVFYELAVRHASQLPVIHVIASDQKIPFDVADLRTISIDIDLDGAERSRQAIIAQAKEIEAGHVGGTPIKVAAALKHLSSGKSDEQLVLKQILDGITEMRSDIRKTLVDSRVTARGGTTRKGLNDELNRRLIAFLAENGDTLERFEVRRGQDEFGTEYRVLTKSGRKAVVRALNDDPERILDGLFHELNEPSESS